MDFPDRGDEEPGEDPRRLVDEFEQSMLRAVEKRLRADVPVGSYLSGGVDSSMIVALACHLKGPAINTYTIRVDAPELDELSAANLVARHIGTKPPIVQEFRAEDALKTYPELIQAAEAPVIDTSCAALLQLARRVHDCGQKVVLTGEGADEWLVGYPWYKAAKMLEYLDILPGRAAERPGAPRLSAAEEVPQYPRELRRRIEESVGGPNAWIDSYGVLGLSKLRFYAEPMREVLDRDQSVGRAAAPVERAKRWHPLNRGIWVAARVTLAGHLLQAKGDRVAMHSSVEVRYPFLDEDVFDFLAKLHPSWKLRGFRDKHLLRLLAERWLPAADLPAPQGDFPRSAGQLPHRSGTSVRRAAPQRRIAASHGLFRHGGGAPLADCFSTNAGGFPAPSLRGNGPGRRGRHAAVASPVISTRRWRSCPRGRVSAVDGEERMI